MNPDTNDALRWRKASEELPGPGVDVLVFARREYGIAAFRALQWAPEYLGGWSDGKTRVLGYWDTDLWLPIPPRPTATTLHGGDSR